MNDQQAAAGWYPVDDGRLRYWDGAAWTDQFTESNQGTSPGKSSRLKQAASNAASRLTSNEHDVPEDTLWSAIGKGVGGITTGRYRLDLHYLYASKGALRTDSQQVPIASVVDVDVRQTLTQKARGVCSVIVHVQHAAGGREIISLDDVTDGAAAQRVINQTARDARILLEHRSIHFDGLRHQATNTTRQEIAYEGLHVSGSSYAPGLTPGQGHVAPIQTGAATSPAQAPEPVIEAIEQAAAVVDPIEQLTKLGSLRDAGILTEEEFSAKKAEILGRM